MKPLVRSLIVAFTFIPFFIFGQEEDGSCFYDDVVLFGDVGCNNSAYVLVFEDDFDGINLNRNDWGLKPWREGALYDGEYNTLDNLEISGGLSKIYIKRETVTRKLNQYWPADTVLEDGVPNLRTYHFTGSHINSKKKFSYGKFEIRCKIPKGRGYWPAFWMFGGNDWNEIDVFEFWNEYTRSATTLQKEFDLDKSVKTHHMTNHYKQFPDDIRYFCEEDYKGADFSADFHTFSVTWTPFKIEWYVDGELKYTHQRYFTELGQLVSCNSYTSGSRYSRSKSFPIEPMHIIFNVAIGGTDKPDKRPDSTTPDIAAMEVDYIRYYKQMPCEGELNITEKSELNLDSELYNVIYGSSVNFSGNITIDTKEQLKVLARDEVTFDKGFSIDPSANFVAEINPNHCPVSRSSANEGGTTHELYKNNRIESSNNNTIKTLRNNVYITPNPTQEMFTLSLSENKNYHLQLLDVTGKTVLSLGKMSGKSQEIDVSQLENGIYFLKLTNANEQLTERIVVTR